MDTPLDVSSRKSCSSSESEIKEVEFIAHLNLKHVTLSLVFIIPIQDFPLKTFTPQDLHIDQACSIDTSTQHNNLSV